MTFFEWVDWYTVIWVFSSILLIVIVLAWLITWEPPSKQELRAVILFTLLIYTPYVVYLLE